MNGFTLCYTIYAVNITTFNSDLQDLEHLIVTNINQKEGKQFSWHWNTDMYKYIHAYIGTQKYEMFELFPTV